MALFVAATLIILFVIGVVYLMVRTSVVTDRQRAEEYRQRERARARAQKQRVWEQEFKDAVEAENSKQT